MANKTKKKTAPAKVRRDGAGRFLDGTAPGPGNPYNHQVAQLRAAMIGAVSEKDLTAVVRKLVTMSKSGSTAAARLLLAYCCGNPKPLEDTAADGPQVIHVVYEKEKLPGSV